MGKSSPDWSGFDRILASLAQRAKEVVCAPSIGQTMPVRMDSSGSTETMRSAEALLAIGHWLGEATTEELLATKNWPQGLIPSGTVVSDRGAELHAELLAATWLGLYFLGVPFNEPWERARRLIESAGGYPHGACINKAIGDIYRWARRKLKREYGAPVAGAGDAVGSFSTAAAEGSSACEVPPYGLVVYTRRPMAMVPLHLWEPPRSVAANKLAELGRCYALLQLRLYAGSGLPFAYIVPNDVVARALTRNQSAPSVAQWLVQTMGAVPRAGQTILVSKHNEASDGMPTCVLAPTRGLATLEGLPANGHDHGISFAGHRVGSALTESYRTRLRRFDAQALAWSDVTSLDRALQSCAALPADAAA